MNLRHRATTVRAITGPRRLPRIAAALAAALALVACGGSGGGPAAGPDGPATGPLGPPDNARYYPLVEGARWINTQGQLVRVEGPDLEAGPDAWRVLLLNGPTPSSQTFRLKPNAVEFVGTRASDPLFRALGDFVLLRLPVRTNDTWLQYDKVVDNVVDVDNDGRPDRLAIRATSTVLGYEAVTVAAGQFVRALKVRTESRQTVRFAATGAESSGVVVTDAWYVADLGRVLSVSSQQSPPTQLGRDELLAYRVGNLRTDTQSPVIRSTWPAPGETTARTNVAVDFSEPMDTLSTPVPITLTGPDGSPVAGTTRWDGPNRLIFQFPEAPLSGTYSVRLDPRLGDWLGNTVESGLNWQTTLDLNGPRLTNSSPAAGATEVRVDSAIEIVLDEPAELVSIQVSQGERFLSGTLTGSGREWRFTPQIPWFRAASYEVVVAGFDLLGNRFLERYGFDTEVGRFAAEDAPLASPGHSHIATADVDGDGRSDVVVLRKVNGSSDEEFMLFRQRAAGGFEASRIGPAPWLTKRFELADIDGDGRIDLLPSQATVWWRQLGSGQFEAQALPSPQSDVSDAFMLRSAGGRRDIVSSLDWRPQVMRQTAPGVFAPAEPLETPQPGQEGVADVNGDGLDDIVAANQDAAGRGILLIVYQGPDGRFGSVQSLPAGSLPEWLPQFVRVVDIDLDGHRDLVFSLGGGVLSSLRVIRQTAPGVFAAATGPDDAGRWAEVADIDGDGRPDLISAGFGFVALHLQRPDGSFGPGELYHDARFSWPTDAQPRIAVADFNGDGRPDIWAGGVLWLQRGTGLAAMGRSMGSRRSPSWPLLNAVIR